VADRQTKIIGGDGTQALAFTLDPGLFQYVQSVLVEVDTSGSGDVQPTLSVQTVNGVPIADKQQGLAIDGGGAGRATWALRLTDEGQGGLRYHFVNDGDWVYVEADDASGLPGITGNTGYLIGDFGIYLTAAHGILLSTGTEPAVPNVPDHAVLALFEGIFEAHTGTDYVGDDSASFDPYIALSSLQTIIDTGQGGEFHLFTHGGQSSIDTRNPAFGANNFAFYVGGYTFSVDTYDEAGVSGSIDLKTETFTLLDSNDDPILQVREGGGTPTYHIKAGATWVADL
jgi:hypothetical protein